MIPDVQPIRPSGNGSVAHAPVHERRAVPRITPDEKIRIEIDWSKGQMQSLSKPIFASGIDISLHGIQMSLDYSIPVGFELDLLIHFLDRDEQFTVSGTVAWAGTVEGTRQHRVGVWFNMIAGDELDTWNRLLLN